MMSNVLLYRYMHYSDFIYATPAGVQLDLIQPDELFCHTQENVDVELPNPDKKFEPFPIHLFP